MSNNKNNGNLGEQEIVDKIPCPNCNKDLMLLPPNYPLYDIQCTGCSFRAQIKTNQTKPKDKILGAGWDIMEKVLKSGYMIPPLFTNFKYKDKGIEKQIIKFYPFIPKCNLEKYQLSPTAKRANYKMFRYIGLNTLPHFILYEK